MEILPAFCGADDFCLLFEPCWKQQLLVAEKRHRNQAKTLCLSEVMTIIVLFHSSGYRNFKTFYTQHVLKHPGWAFSKLISYNRGLCSAHVKQIIGLPISSPHRQQVMQENNEHQGKHVDECKNHNGQYPITIYLNKIASDKKVKEPLYGVIAPAIGTKIYAGQPIGYQERDSYNP